jgi:GxxExxY protein
LNREEHEGRQGEVRRAIEQIGTCVVDSAIRVHCALGPGLLESTYEHCLAYELRRAGHSVDCQVTVPIQYREIKIDAGYRLDLLVDRLVIVENKAVERLLAIHATQLLSYLRLTNLKLGFLINWNVSLLRDGLHRYVNEL